MTRRLCQLVDHSRFNPTKSEWLIANQLIDAQESSRISEYMFKRDAKASMIVQLLIRKACCERWKVKNQEIQVNRSMRGKPFVTHVANISLPPFAFSVSHSGNYTLFVQDMPDLVGCDLMKVEMSEKHFEIHRRHAREFTASEWQFIERQQLQADRIAAFMRFWCLKEAYLKATGEGITVDLKQLNFQLGHVEKRVATRRPLLSELHVFGTTLQFAGNAKPDWRFEEILIDVARDQLANDQYVLAIAVRGESVAEDEPTAVEILHPGELICSLASYTDSIATDSATIDHVEKLWSQFEAKSEAPNRRLAA